MDHPKATRASSKNLLHASMVADLLVSELANQPITKETMLADFLQESVLMLMEGRASKLASNMGVTKSSLSEWMTGKHRPEFARILQIAELHGCSLEDVLSGRSENAKLTSMAQGEQARAMLPRRNRGDIDWKQVVATLKAEFTEVTPMALSEVASRIGIDVDTLRNREPELCRAISKRWQSWRKSSTHSRDVAYAQQVRMHAQRMATQGTRPTWQRLLEDGLPAILIWQWRTFVQKICDEVWEETETSQRSVGVLFTHGEARWVQGGFDPLPEI